MCFVVDEWDVDGVVCEVFLGLLFVWLFKEGVDVECVCVEVRWGEVDVCVVLEVWM